MSRTSSTLVESIARFRARANTVFRQWAYAWLQHTVDSHVTRDRSDLLVTVIQLLYWSVLHRNPTVAEWAHAVVRYGQQPLHASLIREELQHKRTPESDASKLNMLKPWWSLYHLAGHNEEKAVRAYARQVGMAFLSHRLLVDSLPADIDWLDPDGALTRVMNPVKSNKGFWRKLLTFSWK